MRCSTPPRTSQTSVGPLIETSSSPSKPWTRIAWRVPISSSTRPSCSTSARSGTPISCACARAGLVSGPRMLKTVRMPISRRGGPAYFIAGWNDGAYMKPIPTSRMQRATCSGVASIRTPSPSSTSALPHWLVAERLPCFASRAPAAAATIAAAVEMLNELLLSPPVPQQSTMP